MNNSRTTLFLLVSSFFIFGCNHISSVKPAFKDGDRTLHNLISKYQCENIEFENWTSDDLKDSTLTICLINSKTFHRMSPDSSLEEFKSVASQIKHSLEKPDAYNSYYVIFVKKEGNFVWQTRNHSAGSDIPSSDLDK